MITNSEAMTTARTTAVRTPHDIPHWGWQEQAACRDLDVLDFFGPDGERQAEREVREERVKLVCAECPVRRQCLEHALRQPERYGVWGGLTEVERVAVIRRRRRAAAA